MEIVRNYGFLHTNGRQHRSHRPIVFLRILGLAVHLGFRATRRLYRSARRARPRRRALYNGATRPRARRTVTYLTRLVTCADTRRAGRNSRLQNVARHIRRRRALRLEHILAQIGLRRARRNGRLQNILGPIYFLTWPTSTRRARFITCGARARTRSHLSARAARLRNVHEPLHRIVEGIADQQTDKQNGNIRYQIFPQHFTLVYPLN
jgi:hypothetical protein